jgi:tetratricopeptide (TPR) repeat protein
VAIPLVCIVAQVRAQDAEFYFKRAEESFRKMDDQSLQSAISDYSEAIRLAPNRSDVYEARADTYDMIGDSKKALADYSEAIRLAPNNFRLYRSRGDTYDDLGDFKKAMANYSQAIRLSPNDSDLYKHRADMYKLHDDYPKAIADYGEAIRLDPNNSDLHEWRGHAYVHQGEYDKAIASFTTAIQLMSKAKKDAISMNIAYASRADAWKRKGRYDKAIAGYEEATQVHPTAAWSFADLAWLQATCPDEKSRDGQKAFRNANKAYQLTEGKYWHYLDVLAAAYAECGDFDHARQWETKAIEKAKSETDQVSTPKDIEEATARLELYKQNKPYHEEPKK